MDGCITEWMDGLTSEAHIQGMHHRMDGCITEWMQNEWMHHRMDAEWMDASQNGWMALPAKHISRACITEGKAHGMAAVRITEGGRKCKLALPHPCTFLI